ncbi:hypothetical protein JTB14_016425 [Gonioctena quinquepunctata]|nr:hypothetical protein JTB14_016425 [Gonioctena quinquepunctata]
MKTPEMDKSLKDLICLCCKNIDIQDDYSYESMLYPDPSNSETAALYKCSPFFIFFNNYVQDQNYISDGFSSRNEYFNKKCFTLFLKKYIAYLPMWCGIFTCERLSNAPVERWFEIAKNSLAEGLLNQKCSRIINKIREHVIFIHKEQIHNIPKGRCASNSVRHSEDEGLLAEETWRKKQKAPHTTNFEHPKLKKFLQFDPNLCLYCKQGALDVTAEWIQCGECYGWVHISCIIGYENLTFSGEFTCDFCLADQKNQTHIENHESVENKQNNIEILQTYLDKNVLDKKSIDNIEIDTRGQSKSILWKNERRKSVTASHFGEICKAKSIEKKTKIAIEIIFPKSNFNKYIKHGKDNEMTAVNEYEKLNKKICQQTDFKNKSISFLNPMGTHEYESKRYMGSFSNFMNEFYPEQMNEMQEWTINQHEYDTQSDDYNCGVYIILYYQQLVNYGNVKRSNIDIKQFRNSLMKRVLLHSDDMKCLFLLWGFDHEQKNNKMLIM